MTSFHKAQALCSRVDPKYPCESWEIKGGDYNEDYKKGLCKVWHCIRRSYCHWRQPLANADELGLGGKGIAVDKSNIKGADFDKVVPYTCLVCNIEDGGLAYIKDGRVRKLGRK